MTIRNKILWITTITYLLAILIAEVYCEPIEVVYTNDGCDCPKKLGYEVNLPSVKLPKYNPLTNYGYKIQKPLPPHSKAHVAYTFDITVEEPQQPLPAKAAKQNLYAKVDRMTARKGDCAPHHHRHSSAATACGCAQSKPPQIRYVYEQQQNVKPCKCKKETCRCNVKHEFLPYNGRVVRVSQSVMPNNNGDYDEEQQQSSQYMTVKRNCQHNNKRNKRDTRQTLFKNFNTQGERPGRFIKKYNTNLSNKRQAIFGELPSLPTSPAKAASVEKLQPQHIAKRKTRKVFKHQPKTHFGHRFKRDIKAEYDLIEKERDQMDLTLPDIVQFMPETLQPNFKRGQCQFNCQHATKKQQDAADKEVKKQQQTNEEQTQNEQSETTTDSNTETTEPNQQYRITNGKPLHLFYIMKPNRNDNKHNNHGQQQQQQQHEPIDNENNNNKITTTKVAHNKRNALNYFNNDYYYDTPTATLTTKDHSYNNHMNNHKALMASFHAMNLNPFPIENAYQSSYPFTSDPNCPYARLNANAAITQPQQQQQQFEYQYQPYDTYAPTQYQPEFVYDGTKYLPNYGNLQKFITGTPVPDPYSNDKEPLHFTGDLESPPSISYEHIAARNPFVSSIQPPQPVQHLSNEELDKVIQDIIYKHPDFVDATSHYGGALVDPEPQQKFQTIGFLKKLIDGRLHKWFGGASNEKDDDDLHYPEYKSASNVYYLPQSTSPQDYDISSVYF